MLYIHDTKCISPQHSFDLIDLTKAVYSAGNMIQAIEPSTSQIPEKVLRRMGKAVRLGVASAMPLIKSAGNPDGIIVGTANGGMEDCIKFLNQIIEYDEGMLTPTNFVQSTANAIAGQVGMLLKNKGYNITHVHRGHSFENALIDAAMQLAENTEHSYLVGGVDEISAYDFNIDLLNGWFKSETGSDQMYLQDTPGSYAGEGAAMFIVNNNPVKGSIRVEAIGTITTLIASEVKDYLSQLIEKYDLKNKVPDLLLSGENGDNRLNHFYMNTELLLPATTVARFKHLTGEFATASSAGLWLASEILRRQHVPKHMLKYAKEPATLRSCIIYNAFKGNQHSFILCSIV